MTLIEILTVVAIITMLVALFLSSISSAREKARRIGCVNNMRQMIQGALLYAEDDSQGSLSSALDDGKDVLSYLYPNFVSTLDTFVCPSTENYIRTDRFVTNPFTGQKELLDLTGYNGSATSPGPSYEVFGFMNATPDTPNYTEVKVLGQTRRVPGVKKTLSSIQSHTHHYNAFGLRGVAAGPSGIWLFLDGDEPPGIPNFPDANNNHGDSGSNIAFCDGHVEWVPTKRYVYSYELSQDENRSGP